MTTSTVLASLVLLTACGNIIDPTNPTTDPTGDHGLDAIDGIDLGAGDGGGSDGGTGSDTTPPPPMLPFVIQAPQAATSVTSLFHSTFANSEIRDVVLSESAAARFAILEQHLVTKIDSPIEVTLSITPPAGTFARAVATDTVLANADVTLSHTLCGYNGIDYGEPVCNTVPPPKSISPASGAITAARYNVQLIDDANGEPVAGCIASGTFGLTCVLPARAGAAYTLRLSGDGFAQLWNGFSGLADTTLDGARMSGVIQAHEFMCAPAAYYSDSFTHKDWCDAYYVYNRYTGIDAASLSFAPMTVTISAAGATEALTSPALTWDAGNDDLPGANY